MARLGQMAKSISMRTRVLLVLAVFAAVYAYQQLRPVDIQPGLTAVVTPKVIETAHYAITSTATDRQTMLVGNAVESLYAAYLSFFSPSIGSPSDPVKLKLTLYRDQGEFRAHNQSAGWAEAYYLPPTCFAYFAGDEANPYHWMLHEATHQLNHEVAHFPQAKWINEGLATYFGTSAIRAGRLIPGLIDANTYPIWGVKRLTLSGDLQKDIRSGKIIGLRALISGVGGPSMDERFNAYYIGYWSLTHFLFHVENGRYAQRYRKLIAEGGTLDNFETVIGPVARIEGEWYAYLQQQAGAFKPKPP
jgi:hypothetical protein